MNAEKAKKLNYLIMNHLAETEYGYDSFQEVVDLNKELADEIGLRVYKMPIGDKIKLEKKLL